MRPATRSDFNRLYEIHLKHLKLNGLQPKTIEAGADLLEVQKILGHQSILTTARYNHLTTLTGADAEQYINALMAGFSIRWDGVR